MYSLFEVSLLLLYAWPALLCQELSHLLVHPGPAVMRLQGLDSFRDAPVSLCVHVLDQVLPQGRWAHNTVPGKIISRDSARSYNILHQRFLGQMAYV